MLPAPEAAPHRIYGADRFGPALPGTGPIIQVLQYEFGMGVVRYTGGSPPTAVYLLRNGEEQWERLFVH